MSGEAMPGRPDTEPQVITPEANRPDPPRLYLASLSDYNNGRLHGTWVDMTQDDDTIAEQLAAMLRASPEPYAEEWAIHDHDGWGALAIGEYESLTHLGVIGRGIAEHGTAFAAWAKHLDPAQWDRLNEFQDHYLGTWDSLTEYAESLLEDCGIDVDNLGPEHLQDYIRFDLDLDAYARDLSWQAGVIEDDEGIHLFEEL